MTELDVLQSIDSHLEQMVFFSEVLAEVARYIVGLFCVLLITRFMGKHTPMGCLALLLFCPNAATAGDPLTDHPAWLLGTESGLPFSIDSDDYTISVVFNVTGTTGMVGFDSEHFRVAQMVNGMGLTYVWNGTSYAQNYFSGAKVWNRWTVSKSGSSLKFWANGVLMFDRVAVDGGSLTPRVGVSSGGGGRVSSVEVWSDAQDGSLTLADPDAVFVPDEDGAGASREQMSDTWFPWSGTAPTIAYESDNPGDVLDEYGDFSSGEGYSTFRAQAAAAAAADPYADVVLGDIVGGQCVVGVYKADCRNLYAQGVCYDCDNEYSYIMEGGQYPQWFIVSSDLAVTHYPTWEYWCENGLQKCPGCTLGATKTILLLSSDSAVKCSVCGQCPPCASNGDKDGDGEPNSSDPDVDGDGIPNEADATPWGDCLPVAASCTAAGDVDGDDIRNDAETDADADGIDDVIDATPYGSGCAPLGGPCDALGDADGDGIQNEDDPDGDIDGDTIPDDEDAKPYGNSCGGGSVGGCGPADDFDGDGQRNDAEGPDADGDGIPNECDWSPFGDGGCTGSTNPCADTGDMNGDGILNGCNFLGEVGEGADDDGDFIPNESDPCPRGFDCCECDDIKADKMIDGTLTIETDEVDGHIYCYGKPPEDSEPRDGEEAEKPLYSFEEYEEQCDWDGDGCVNIDDPFPCDPSIDCAVCDVDIERHVKRIQYAVAKWFYGANAVSYASANDKDGTLVPENMTLTPRAGTEFFDLAFPIENLAEENPTMFSIRWRFIPRATDNVMNSPGSTWVGSFADLAPALEQLRTWWQWVRAGILIWLAVEFGFSVLDDVRDKR